MLIFDEATAGLDRSGAAAFYRRIEEVRSEAGCAVLMVSHDLHVVMSASDRVICLNGHVCCEGAPEVVAEAPVYRALFGEGTQGALALYRHPLVPERREGRLMLSDFMVRAILAGIGTALAAAPLGCLVVWRRMAYFGDATAHAAILGVALSLALSLPIFAGTVVMALLMAGAVAALAGRSCATDTALGVMAHSSLACGLVAVSLLETVRIDVCLLFGDILAVSLADSAVIWGGAILVGGLVAWRWPALLLSTLIPISPEPTASTQTGSDLP